MSTEKIEVDSEKLKAFLDCHPVSFKCPTGDALAADILARNLHLSEIEVTVRLTVEEMGARAARDTERAARDTESFPTDAYGRAGRKLGAACRAKLAESRP